MTPLFSRHQPGGVFTIQDMEEHPNNVLWVNSAHSAAQNALGGGQNPDKPFATLAYVLTNAATLTPALAAGDVIYVAPTHTETIATAGGIACATAGIKIIGLGWGAARPTFTWSATASTWTVTAASVYIKNIRVGSSVNELVTMFSSSASDLVLDCVDYLNPGSGLETLQFLLTTSASNRFEVKRCTHHASTAGASAQLWIAAVGCLDFKIHHNDINLTLNDAATSSVFNFDSGVRRAFLYKNNVVMLGYSSNMLSVLLANGSATGQNTDSNYSSDVAAITSMNDFAGGHSNNVFCERAVDKSGVLDPVVT